ncbi:peptide ABC transporter substrate-binding protein [Curtobacterium ammoniigenes]|uniref:peptide ABC transporter substrate-binding protein n=1 Tax=Curtobacterium ammoniigenes TaxID=395387 RepID=UPI00083077C1|nr:peptide ABC transporter substrate-binding protein [Curtobacterium ammoniigenes]
MFPARSAARRTVAVLATAAAAALLLAGCSGGGSSQSGSGGKDSINYALPPNFTPNWILPVGAPGKLNTNNGSIAAALWEPLVAYDGSTGTVGWHKDASVASNVTFNSAGTEATITLAKRQWSDGKPVTSRDVEFWYNLVKANKANWGNYNKGQAPDNWTKLTVVDDTHFTITFDKAYNTQWMLANELSLITPMPQHAWDKTSASGSVGNADETAAGAVQVWKFLNQQAGQISSYATNPLWKVVDGPYTVSKFTTSGNVTLSANSKYDGGEKAKIATVNLMPFTSADAEENAVRSGQVDYGYIQPTSLDQKASFTAKGYTVDPWTGWAITYFPYNFNNPTMGPVFKQMYARQAIQESVDQKGLVSAIFHGTATAGYGPIPQSTKSDFLSPTQANNPYPFSNTAAKKLLTDHGWTAGSDGIMVCQNAGSGANQCGTGVPAGTKFTMQVLAQSGSSVTDNEMSALQSEFKSSGIGFTIKQAPVNTVLSQTPQCTSDQSICQWQLSYFGTAGSWYFAAYPTGDSLFQTGGGANFGNYSNPEADSLITATTQSNSSTAIKSYSATLAKQLPVIWLPEPDYQISVIKKGLTAPQDPMANFHPARWSWGQ